MANAQGADLTVAFAADYTSAGERLTASASGNRYVAIPLGTDPVTAARALYRALRQHKVSTLNIAGNGLHTLSKHGWDQSKVNEWVYRVLAIVLPHWPLERVRTGGQLGVDMAGGIAARALGIDVLLFFPKGLRQRGADGQDFNNTAISIMRQVEEALGLLGSVSLDDPFDGPGITNVAPLHGAGEQLF